MQTGVWESISFAVLVAAAIRQD